MTNTAYVSGGPVFNTCESIVETKAGYFSKDEVEEFNAKTNQIFNATEILCHYASFGKIYRIEYTKSSPHMRCS